MDHQFDALAKALAEGISRRDVLRRAGTGLAGTWLASLGLSRAWGQSGAVDCGRWCNQKYPSGKTRGRCASTCDSCQSSGGSVCGTNGDGSVKCCAGGPTSVCCNGACVDTTSDPAHCGGCGHACGSGESCVQGTCYSFSSRCDTCCRHRTYPDGDYNACYQACLANNGVGYGNHLDACSSGSDCCLGNCLDVSGYGLICVDCFIAGTRIRMSDGSERPIEQIRIDDLLLGPDGEANRVVELRRPRLRNRKLYALNGSRQFVTAAHPFMTSDGWKSFDPEATMRENPGLPVGKLSVGDLLVAAHRVPVLATAGGAGAAEPAVPELISIPVTHIEGREADPETPLFNLHVEGRHVYFADGFLVHNK